MSDRSANRRLVCEFSTMFRNRFPMPPGSSPPPRDANVHSVVSWTAGTTSCATPLQRGSVQCANASTVAWVMVGGGTYFATPGANATSAHRLERRRERVLQVDD